VNETLPDPVPRPGQIVVHVRAAGICHSDGHYRAGRGRINLPLTLGHEIAGVVEGTGQRVALHYLLPDGDMLGKEVDGGYAERVVVPGENAVPIPDGLSFEHAAIMMCSTATVHHALKLSALRRGESVLILGFGGLGVSAVQLAKIHGATEIFAIDVVPEKLELARSFGALTPREMPSADVVLDFAGHEATTLAALQALRPGGRLMVVAINLRSMTLDPYADVLAKERRIIGCSDHTREELVELMSMPLDLSGAITRRVPLDAAAINEVLADLDRGTSHLRTVISP
jgi:2-desacetyl-2-hydroxyethyl bacteriochlorophyllide A dehydrogenase